MTNIVATVALIISTNWTDQIHDEKQLGFLVTNHVATVIYQGETNIFTLKQDTGPFVWGGTKKVTGSNVFGETHTWCYITNGGFTRQDVYKDGKWEESSQWGGFSH